MAEEGNPLGLVIGAVCGVLVLGLIIALSLSFLAGMSQSVSSLQTINSPITGEIFLGTNGSAHALAHSPLVAITTFKASTLVSQYNDTQIANVSTTRTFTLTAPIDTGSVSGNKCNLTVNVSKGTGSTVQIYTSGSLLGNASGGVESWNGLTPVSPFTVSTNFSGENASNVSNITLKCYTFQTSTAYGVTSLPAATITPTANGAYRVDYTYTSFDGLDVTSAQTALASTQSAIGDFPGWLPMVVLTIIMTVVLALVAGIIIYVSRVQGGGAQ